MNVKDEASYWSYTIGWRIVRLMPERVAYRMFQAAADELWRRQGSGVRQLEKNLQRVLPDASPADIRAISREGMRNYLRYWCDAFRLPTWSRQDILHRHRAVNDHLLREALDAGSGAVFAGPHCGNYDLTAAWATIRYAQVATVAERLKPERLYEEFLDYRRAVGMEVLPHAGGSATFERLSDWLRDNKIVALLADRDLSRHGMEVDLLGHQARVPVGPAALALHTGAPLFPIAMYYQGGRAYVHVYPAVEKPPGDWTTVDRHSPEFREATALVVQRCADQLGVAIRAHADHWHMLQKVFVEDLDPDRRRT